MHIGILTFHAPHNFGSMLQNYALQQFLIAKGHSVETINLRNEKQKYMYNHPLHIGKSCPTYRALLGRFKDPKWLLTECKTWYLFEHFLKHNLSLTKEYRNWSEIKQELPKLNFDAVIIGGDQIWNTYCYDFDWSYFLPDNIKPTKKIAFCPSFGNQLQKTKEDKQLISTIKACLTDFDFISVREKDSSEYLSRLLNKNVPVVLDPTFLIESNYYLQLLKEPIVNEPYIYYYTPSHITDTEAENVAIGLANLLDIKIVSSYPRFKERTKMINVASGPIEFLNLLYNAQIVIGKSFHLIVFSILFHKDFITIKKKNDARISSLLNLLKIEKRNIDIPEEYKFLKPIDYLTAERELTKFREETIIYLNNSLLTNSFNIVKP